MSRQTRRPKGARTALVTATVLVVGLLTGGEADTATQVVQDPTAFAALTPASAVAFPPDVDTALPRRPFRGLTGYSCADAGQSIDLGDATVRVAGAPRWACFIDTDWNAGLGNVDPHPVSSTLIAEGEDDFVIELDRPATTVALGLLTNASAQERLTVTATDGSTTVFEDAALGTATNAFEFVGVASPEGIRSVAIDTTGGGFQNAGLTGIAIGLGPLTVEVAVDIKPGDARNCVNPRAAGVVPVAVLTTASFNAATVEARTVTLEGARARSRGRNGPGTMEDVDRDGDLDLLVHIDDPSVLAGKTRAELRGLTVDGAPVHGSDVVCTVGNRRPAARHVH